MKIWIDTEFTDFINQDLISIAAVAENGDSFYGENIEFKKNWSSQFVKENIYPLLDPIKYGMSRVELASRLWSWMEEFNEDIILMADYNGDFELIEELFQDKHPRITDTRQINNALFLDFLSVYLTSNEKMLEMPEWFNFYVEEYFKRTKEIPHHALSDAKANREAYLKTVEQFIVRHS